MRSSTDGVKKNHLILTISLHFPSQVTILLHTPYVSTFPPFPSPWYPGSVWRVMREGAEGKEKGES